MGVPPSGGPGACGCAADQLCVTWARTGDSHLDCWTAPAKCFAQLSPTSSQAVCACFNPCTTAGQGIFCFDRNNSSMPLGPENLACVEGHP